jgi:hypothetical protein
MRAGHLDDEGALDLISGIGALDERIARFVSSKKVQTTPTWAPPGRQLALANTHPPSPCAIPQPNLNSGQWREYAPSNGTWGLVTSRRRSMVCNAAVFGEQRADKLL